MNQKEPFGLCLYCSFSFETVSDRQGLLLVLLYAIEAEAEVEDR